MTSPRRIDANQPSIVAALRAVGVTVHDTHELGRGYPDLTCYYRGQVYLLEVKSPRGKLTEPERKFHDDWADCDTLHIVRSPEDALRAVGAA